MKKSDFKKLIKEEIKKTILEERDIFKNSLIRGALNQLKEAGNSALNSMIDNLSSDEAEQLNNLITKGIGKKFNRIPTNSPAGDPRLTPGTTD
jgi:formate dehydrogenase maturation protein FdhE